MTMGEGWLREPIEIAESLTREPLVESLKSLREVDKNKEYEIGRKTIFDNKKSIDNFVLLRVK